MSNRDGRKVQYMRELLTELAKAQAMEGTRAQIIYFKNITNVGGKKGWMKTIKGIKMYLFCPLVVTSNSILQVNKME